MRPEIREVEIKKTVEKISKFKNEFIENINKMDESLSNQVKKKDLNQQNEDWKWSHCQLT